MPAPFFTTNDSEIPRLEGLYVKERNPPAAISGAFLGIVGMVGEAVRGPVDKAVVITSEARFKEVFGGRNQTNDGQGSIVGKMWQALLNKPFGQLVCVRAAASAAAMATATIYGNTFGTGTIQCVAKASLNDGEKVTINDGVDAAVDFVFKLTGGSVSAGQVKVDLTNAVTAQDVAAALVAAIVANNVAGSATPCGVQATLGASGLINLTTQTSGTAGNQAITKTVANVGFTVSGFSGGANNQALVTINAGNAGSWSNNVSYQVLAPTDGVWSDWNLTATYLGKSFQYKNLNISATGTDNTLATIGTDDGNVIALVKLASGLPTAMSAAINLSGGSDGTIADSDFTASSRGLNVLAAYKGLGVVFIAERSSAVLRAYMATLAAKATDRIYVIDEDNETISSTTAQTDVALNRSDRIIFAFNSPYTIDPENATEIITHPSAWMASVLSQIDVDIHPGEEDTKKILAGITRLYNETYQRDDYAALRAAGIAALERDGNDGIAFLSGVTTSLVPGKTEITRRRMADYIQLSLANTLKFSVKKKNTVARRAANAGMTTAFLSDLAQAGRIVDSDASGNGLFIVDTEILNTTTQRALGIEKMLVRVKLISHILELVLETEIGTAVNIKQTQ